LVIDFIFTVPPNFIIYDSPKCFAIHIKLLCLSGLLLAGILPPVGKYCLQEIIKTSLKFHQIANDI